MNLDTKECLEKEEVSPRDFINFQFKVKGGEELFKQISDDIFESIEFDEFYKEMIKRNRKWIEGINSKIQKVLKKI